LLFRWLQLIPVKSYISCSTFAVSLYINSCILVFPLPFAVIFLSAGTATFISTQVLSFPVFNYYTWSIYRNLSICVHLLILQHCHIFMFTYWHFVCLYHFAVVSMSSALRIQ
jgi:hypothetical protein